MTVRRSRAARARHPPAHLRRRRRADRRAHLRRRRRPRAEGVQRARRRRHEAADAGRHHRRVDHRQPRAGGDASRARARRRSRHPGRRRQAHAVGGAARASSRCRLPPAPTSATIFRTFPSSPAAASPCRCPHAPPSVRAHAHFVTQREGGKGAVRELCEMILAAQGMSRARRVGDDADCARASIGWSPGRRCCCWAASRRSPIGSTRRCSRPGGATTDRRGTTPTFTSSDFSAVTFDVDGRVRQMLAATRAEHFPDDGSVDLVAPVARADRSRQAPPRGHRRQGHGFRRSGNASRCAATSARRATPRRRPRATRTPLGAATFTTEMLRDHSEGGAGRNRRPRDDRGGAWNNPGRRDGPRQQCAHGQAQVRRARNPPTEQAAEVKSSIRNRIAPRRGAGAAPRRPSRSPRRSRSSAPAARRDGRPRQADHVSRATPATPTCRRAAARSPAT